MKMKSTLRLVAAVLLLASVSCNKEPETPVEPDPRQEEKQEQPPEEPPLPPYIITNTPSAKHYANLQALLDETGLLSSLGAMGKKIVNDNFTAEQQSAAVTAISYTYSSPDPQGETVELSALMYVPDGALDGSKPLTGICLANHGTIASNAQCPTESAQFEGALAWKNYAIVMPDYYGFGASKDRPQGYLDADNTARNNIDALVAAICLLAERQVTNPDKLYSFGYSQGGFNSMANLKFVSQHPELEIGFEKVFCGGSPFDVLATWNAYIGGTFNNSLAFVPMTLVSINETHKLGLDYARLFKGTLLSNYQDWILSKKYTTNQISDFLDGQGISDILHEDMIAGTGDAYDAVREVCESYSLTGGWTPSPDSFIVLFHSKADDTVPIDNLQPMIDFLESNGFVSGTSGPGHYYPCSEEYYGSHMGAVLYYVLVALKEF